MNKAVRNEQRKLAAGFFNTLASAVIVIGGFAPVVGWVYGTLPADMRIGNLVAGSLVCIIVGSALHYMAQRILRGIEE